MRSFASFTIEFNGAIHKINVRAQNVELFRQCSFNPERTTIRTKSGEEFDVVEDFNTVMARLAAKEK